MTKRKLYLSQIIFVMDGGKIMQSGTPEDIYANSSNPFVANFIGMTNFIEGQVLDEDSIKVDNQQIAINSHSYKRAPKLLLLLDLNMFNLPRKKQ